MSGNLLFAVPNLYWPGGLDPFSHIQLVKKSLLYSPGLHLG
jgi:hypothetical protein